MLTVDVALARPGFALRVAQEFAPDGVTAIFGASGAGKSTLLRVIAGLERAATGSVRFGGEVWQAPGLWLPPEARGIAYVFQDARLFAHLSVAGNLRYADRRARGLPGPGWGEVVQMLDLGPLLGRRVAGLSGGERQRVAIGRALLTRPCLMLLDEPLAALDAVRKAEILPYLERLCGLHGLPILYVSHDIAELARLAENVVVLAAGGVAAAGPLAEVLADPALAGALGPRGAGAVLAATVAAHHVDDGLSELAHPAGRLFVPLIVAAVGSPVRLRIAADDVMLARARPEAISALNILPAEVTALAGGPGGVAVGLRIGPDAALARITDRSARVLALEPGAQVFAILKTVAIARDDLAAALRLDRHPAP
ncbi:MAG: molybdenum ABC transporter ATP-binding protein [Alphaproteobacteria bacterium HGW-Alphaproteobacteria-4]|nr:MAG: molybdenum ABC transporter ATP-binding protein [Alphaproteobacteria bacterium HGW-Alphaproteobacteria-4]